MYCPFFAMEHSKNIYVFTSNFLTILRILIYHFIASHGTFYQSNAHISFAFLQKANIKTFYNHYLNL